MQTISSFLLIESPATENDAEFFAAINRMLLETYGHMPDWLQYSGGARFARQEWHFREFKCIAGSVSALLMRRACRDGGLERSIIYRGGDQHGILHACEIRDGVETEFDPDELQAL